MVVEPLAQKETLLSNYRKTKLMAVMGAMQRPLPLRTIVGRKTWP